MPVSVKLGESVVGNLLHRSHRTVDLDGTKARQDHVESVGCAVSQSAAMGGRWLLERDVGSFTACRQRELRDYVRPATPNKHHPQSPVPSPQPPAPSPKPQAPSPTPGGHPQRMGEENNHAIRHTPDENFRGHCEINTAPLTVYSGDPNI